MNKIFNNFFVHVCQKSFPSTTRQKYDTQKDGEESRDMIGSLGG